jgi:hypothetical protein
MPDLFDEILNAFEPSDAAPMPDWLAAQEWIARTDGDPHSLWPRLAREWLMRIAAWRPPGLRLDEHGDFLLLSGLEPRATAGSLKFMQHCRGQLCRAFSDLVIRDFYGPFVAIIFRDTDEYYDYVADFHPGEGEWGGSGGMYLNRGYGHIVTYNSPEWALRRVLAHEIVHAHFVHRELPLWVEEGLTQTATDLLTETNTLKIDRETVRRQRAYWRRRGLDPFWSGEAFAFPDEGQEHAYTLALVIFKRELEDRRPAFLQFLQDVSADDHGAAAAVRHLKRPLNQVAAEFLGPEFGRTD